MQSGWKTSEFWLALHWTVLAGASAPGLLHSSPMDWPTAVASAIAVGVLVWMAGAVTINYSENRFQLKARSTMQGTEVQSEDPAEERRPFGFRSPRLVERPDGNEEDLCREK